MEINMELLKGISKELNELDELVKEKSLATDVMLDKMGSVIRHLEEINTIYQIDLDNYKSNWKDLELKLGRSAEGMDRVLGDVTDYSDLVGKIFDNKDGKPIDLSLMDKPNRFTWDEAKMKEMENETTLDVSKEVSEVLTGHTHIYFARKRRQWIWRDKWIFRSLNTFTNLIKVLLSGTAGYWAGYCGGLFVKMICPKMEAEYLITMSIMIISFFSLDKWLDRKAREYFWRQTLNEVLILRLHFNLYVDQIYIMVRNKAAEEKRYL